MPASYANHRAQFKAILLGVGHAGGERRNHRRHSVLGRSARGGQPRHFDDPGYDRLRRSGRAKMDARPRIVRETPVSAVVDGGGGLGHVPAHFAMYVGDRQGASASGMAIGRGAQLGAFRRRRLLYV